MQNSLRAFVAMPLPGDCVELLARLQQGLKSHGLNLSWVRPENLHLTMKFLGDIQEADAPAVADGLHRTAARHPALNLTLQGMGVFPGIKRPRVLWAGLGGETPALQALAADLDSELERLGFERERRGFTAHVTLARIRKRVDPQRLLRAVEDTGNYPPLEFTARRIVLFKSDLKPGGAVYTVVEAVDLTTAPG